MGLSKATTLTTWSTVQYHIVDSITRLLPQLTPDRQVQGSQENPESTNAVLDIIAMKGVAAGVEAALATTALDTIVPPASIEAEVVIAAPTTLVNAEVVSVNIVNQTHTVVSPLQPKSKNQSSSTSTTAQTPTIARKLFHNNKQP